MLKRLDNSSILFIICIIFPFDVIIAYFIHKLHHLLVIFVLALNNVRRIFLFLNPFIVILVINLLNHNLPLLQDTVFIRFWRVDYL